MCTVVKWGHTEGENFVWKIYCFFPGQRDNRTSCPGLSRDVPRDVPSLGNPNLNQSHLLIVSDKKNFRQTFYCGNAPVRTSDCCAVLTACLQTEPGGGGGGGGVRVDPHKIWQSQKLNLYLKKNLWPPIFSDLPPALPTIKMRKIRTPWQSTQAAAAAARIMIIT